MRRCNNKKKMYSFIPGHVLHGRAWLVHHKKLEQVSGVKNWVWPRKLKSEWEIIRAMQRKKGSQSKLMLLRLLNISKPIFCISCITYKFDGVVTSVLVLFFFQPTRRVQIRYARRSAPFLKSQQTVSAINITQTTTKAIAIFLRRPALLNDVKLSDGCARCFFGKHLIIGKTKANVATSFAGISRMCFTRALLHKRMRERLWYIRIRSSVKSTGCSRIYRVGK